MRIEIILMSETMIIQAVNEDRNNINKSDYDQTSSQ